MYRLEPGSGAVFPSFILRHDDLLLASRSASNLDSSEFSGSKALAAVSEHAIMFVIFSIALLWL